MTLKPLLLHPGKIQPLYYMGINGRIKYLKLKGVNRSNTKFSNFNIKELKNYIKRSELGVLWSDPTCGSLFYIF